MEETHQSLNTTWSPKIVTEYLGRVYRGGFRDLVDDTVAAITSLRNSRPFDSIAFTGSSGAAMAYPAGYLTGILLSHIRRHGGHFRSGKIEGCANPRGYLIVDDFICSGRTVQRILRALGPDKCIGIIEYGDHSTGKKTFPYKRLRINVSSPERESWWWL